MTEPEKQLLTDNNIPGKVVLDAIYFLNKFESTGKMVPAPGRVSLALALVDIAKEGRKRKEHAGAKSIRHQKQRRVEGNSPGGGQKTKGVVDNKFLTMVEDRVNCPNILVVSKVTDGGENDRVVQHL